MKKIVLLCALILIEILESNTASATHIVGGEMSYTCLGDNQYQLTLKIYRDCNPGNAAYDDPAYIFIFDASNTLVQTLTVSFPGATQLPASSDPCLTVPSNVCVEEAIYITTVTLTPSPGGYTIVYERCCRNNTLGNIVAPGSTGDAFTAVIPDSSDAQCNSSPYFVNFPPPAICLNKPLSFDHSAIDPDGDSLVYYLCAPFQAGDQTCSQPPIVCPAIPPPFNTVTYLSPYTADNPLPGSPAIAIDPVTGLLTVTPTAIGQYVVGICVDEYRNGVLLETHKRDFQFNVVECSPTVVASTPDVINNCASYTVTFQNNSFGGTSYHWDFGVPGMTNDTSNLFTPTFTYPDTGVYTVTLITNPGTTCGDTTTATVYIYPTLSGVMAAPDGCVGNPVQFYDQSTSNFGIIDSWNWSFGDGDTSTAQNPSHLYDSTGTYIVQFIVQTDLGCVDTVTETVVIYPSPTTNVTPNDTLICSLDDVQLNASGSGNFSWQPDYNLSSTTIPNPVASPDVTTTYIVTVSNQYGCFAQDSVKITVIDSVVVFAGNDTTICPGTAIQLNGTGGTIFQWSPSTGLSNPNIHNPVASPQVTTTYTLVSSVGSCTGNDAVTIFVKPFPNISAGDDQSICQGASVQISASGGTSYSWTPASSLSDPNIADPIASPSSTTTYVVTATDSSSCPLVITDSLVVNVIPMPPITIHPDTSIILGTCVDLYVTGGASYQWTPSTGLDNVTSSTPVACPTDSTIYYVTITTADGCVYMDSVKIGIRLDPIVIFPSAFSPNGDGKNDWFRPIILGLARIDDYRIFNRWGELVFEVTGLNVQGMTVPSADPSYSWDGKFKGKDQPVGVYGYELKGIATATGKEIVRKGTLTLVR